MPEKNAQHFPLNPNKNAGVVGGGVRVWPGFLREFRGILGAVLGIQLSKAYSELLSASHSVCQSIRGPEGQRKKKKNLGREKVRVKKGL